MATIQSTIRLRDSFSATLNSFNGGLRNAVDNQEQLNNRMQAAKKPGDALTSSLRNLIGAYAGLQGLKSLAGLSDTLTSTRARIDLMNDGLQTTKELQDMILESANRSRASYQTTADAVSKLGLMAGDAFSNNAEIIAFSELINKQFTIAGASASEASNAMLQLTQAMASGVLRGDELNSIFEQAPTIIQTIADYMGVPIGQIREMASQGQITSDIIKSAMLSSADDINAKFKQMPMTFAQVWTIAKNTFIDAFTPILTVIGQGAQWIYDNWSTIAPIFWGLAAAATGYALALGIQTAATWVATGAAQAFFMTLLTNPLFWIALAIGVVVAAIYKWVQSVGGIKVAWLIACNEILTAWASVKIGFMTGVYWVMNLFNRLQLAFATASTNIQNFCGDMKAGVLTTLQGMVNGAIDIINGFISSLNKIPGVNIGLIEQVTFGTTAQLENEATKQARASNLSAYQEQINQQIADRDAALKNMKAQAGNEAAMRLKKIDEAKSGSAGSPYKDLMEGFDTSNKTAAKTAASTAKTADSVSQSADELKWMRALAERKAINQFTTAEIKVEMGGVSNIINSEMDLDGVVEYLTTSVEEAMAAAAEGSHI